MCDVVAPTREEYDAAFLRLVEVTNMAEAEEGAPEAPQSEPGYNVHAPGEARRAEEKHSRKARTEVSRILCFSMFRGRVIFRSFVFLFLTTGEPRRRAEESPGAHRGAPRETRRA